MEPHSGQSKPNSPDLSRRGFFKTLGTLGAAAVVGPNLLETAVESALGPSFCNPFPLVGEDILTTWEVDIIVFDGFLSEELRGNMSERGLPIPEFRGLPKCTTTGTEDSHNAYYFTRWLSATEWVRKKVLCNTERAQALREAEALIATFRRIHPERSEDARGLTDRLKACRERLERADLSMAALIKRGEEPNASPIAKRVASWCRYIQSGDHDKVFEDPVFVALKELARNEALCKSLVPGALRWSYQTEPSTPVAFASFESPDELSLKFPGRSESELAQLHLESEHLAPRYAPQESAHFRFSRAREQELLALLRDEGFVMESIFPPEASELFKRCDELYHEMEAYASSSKQMRYPPYIEATAMDLREKLLGYLSALVLPHGFADNLELPESGLTRLLFFFRYFEGALAAPTVYSTESRPSNQGFAWRQIGGFVEVDERRWRAASYGLTYGPRVAAEVDRLKVLKAMVDKNLDSRTLARRYLFSLESKCDIEKLLENILDGRRALFDNGSISKREVVSKLEEVLGIRL